VNEALKTRLEAIERRALVIGAAGLAACAIGFFISREQFFQSYLLGFLFWVGLSAGSLVVLLLHHMFGAGWGFSIQRPLEAGARTLPLMAVFFLPIVAGMHTLYEWTHENVMAADKLLQHKSAYLNTPFFLGRTAIYFAVWIILTLLVTRWSQRLDESGDLRIAQRLHNASAPGLLLFGLTASFAAVDWIMSLEPHWFSTIFGLIVIAGQVLATFAFSILAVRILVPHEPYAGQVGAQQFHDLGNLTFAFTMLWAYLNLSQFLIIWSGNLPETIPWYVNRSSGGWQTMAQGLAVLHFALPFFLLLSRKTKKDIGLLSRVAVLLLVMRLVDLFWVVGPVFHPRQFALHWMDVAAPVGIGGIWVWMYVRQLKTRAVLPERDPRMEGVFEPAHEH
jgi:hypothetical protein